MGKVLIHIGYPRTGSTFLETYFGKHPDITINEKLFELYKETGEILPGLADKALDADYYVLSEEQLSAWRGNLKTVGVNFSHYDIKAHQEKVARKLYEAFPNAKILITTRGFASAFSSMYSLYVCIGGVCIFKKFIEKYKDVFAEFYDYDYLIKLYRRIFGEDKVVILPYELMKADLTEFLLQLETKCGIPYFGFSKEKINASLNTGEMVAFRNLSALVYRLIRPLPVQLQENIYSRYVRFLQRKKETALMKSGSNTDLKCNIPNEIMKTFSGKAEVLKLESLYQPWLEEYIF